MGNLILRAHGKSPPRSSSLFAVNVSICKLSYCDRPVVHPEQGPAYSRPPWEFPRETALPFLAQGHARWEPLSNLLYAHQHKLNLLHLLVTGTSSLKSCSQVPITLYENVLPWTLETIQEERRVLDKLVCWGLTCKHILNYFIFPVSLEGGSATLSVLQVRKPRHREGEWNFIPWIMFLVKVSLFITVGMLKVGQRRVLPL